MRKQTMLVTGASGHLGTELTADLRLKFGSEAVIATDIFDLPEFPGTDAWISTGLQYSPMD